MNDREFRRRAHALLARVENWPTYDDAGECAALVAAGSESPDRILALECNEIDSNQNPIGVTDAVQTPVLVRESSITAVYVMDQRSLRQFVRIDTVNGRSFFILRRRRAERRYVNGGYRETPGAIAEDSPCLRLPKEWRP